LKTADTHTNTNTNTYLVKEIKHFPECKATNDEKKIEIKNTNARESLLLSIPISYHMIHETAASKHSTESSLRFLLWRMVKEMA
jgi:hypothetical protein